MKHLALLLLLVIVAACGASSYPDESSTPTPGGGGGTADAAFAKVKPIVDKNCGTCHNGSVHPLKIDTGAKLKAAKKRIENGSMPPPPKKLSPADKDALLGYISG